MRDFNLDRLDGPPSVFAMRDAKREIERLLSVIEATHKLVTEGALVGFVPTEGTWADRLYQNQARLHDALNR